MLRFLCLCLLVAVGQPGQAQPRLPAPHHQQAAEVVWDVMRLDGLMPVLRDEAVAEGRDMAAALFPDGGTGRWLDRVSAIHDPARVKALFLQGMAGVMPGVNQRDVEAGLAFYSTVFGQRILALETSARIAMLDPDTEAAARDAFAQAMRRRDPRAARVVRLIRSADLIDPNVAGSLNGAIAFSRGFQAGGGFPMPLPDGQIIQEAWEREARTRADIEAWIGAYLFLAYAVLGNAEFDRYTAYAASDGGQALSRLMFAGFDAMVSTTSYDMGLAAAAEMRGRQL